MKINARKEAQKYNARLKAMKKSGNVDFGFLKRNLQKAGVEFNWRGNIKQASLSEQTLKALEIQVPNSTGDRNYKSYGELQKMKIKYEEQRQQANAKIVAEQRYKSAIKQRVDEMLETFYGEGKSVNRDDYNSYFYGKSDASQELIEKQMKEVGSLISRGEIDPEQLDELIEKWKSYK